MRVRHEACLLIKMKNETGPLIGSRWYTDLVIELHGLVEFLFLLEVLGTFDHERLAALEREVHQLAVQPVALRQADRMVVAARLLQKRGGGGERLLEAVRGGEKGP